MDHVGDVIFVHNYGFSRYCSFSSFAKINLSSVSLPQNEKNTLSSKRGILDFENWNTIFFCVTLSLVKPPVPPPLPLQPFNVFFLFICF